MSSNDVNDKNMKAGRADESMKTYIRHIFDPHQTILETAVLQIQPRLTPLSQAAYQYLKDSRRRQSHSIPQSRSQTLNTKNQPLCTSIHASVETIL